MKQEMHPVNPFVNMPVSHIPRLVIQYILYSIQPLFRAVVNFGLINSGQKALCRNILKRTCMRKDNIDFFAPDLLLHISLDGWCRLFIVLPMIAHTESAELIYTVCTADDKTLLAVNIENISVYRK